MDLYEEQAELFKAMAHPTRLQILELLSRDECCVCHLTAILQLRQPCVSQHLMVLREHGLVLDRRDGALVFYRLADGRISELIGLTRGLLQRRGVKVGALASLVLPVPGCVCPKCTG